MDRNEKIIADSYAIIMNHLGITFNADNKDTPKRVAKALLEMTESIERPIDDLIDMCTTFENRNGDSVELVQDGIEFSSMCSHHHLPFMGKVRIKYIPNKSIIGLSKFNRIVDFFSRKPQVQEDFTAEIGQFLISHLDPKYVEVEVYETLHTCMCSRGVRSKSTTGTKFTYTRKEKDFHAELRKLVGNEPSLKGALR